MLNRYPYNNGHLMVVPYRHTSSLEYLDDETSLEVMMLLRHSLRILREIYHPQGFNLGVNEGHAGGAGVVEHVHLHIVPRWKSDANYMSVVGETRVMPELLNDSYARLRPYFDAL
jgi:ATP adenylyltransferase